MPPLMKPPTSHPRMCLAVAQAVMSGLRQSSLGAREERANERGPRRSHHRLSELWLSVVCSKHETAEEQRGLERTCCTRPWDRIRQPRVEAASSHRDLRPPRQLGPSELHEKESEAAPRGAQHSVDSSRCARYLRSDQSAPAVPRRTASPPLPALRGNPPAPTTVTPPGVLLAQISRVLHGVAPQPLREAASASAGHLTVAGAELPREQQRPLPKV